MDADHGACLAEDGVAAEALTCRARTDALRLFLAQWRATIALLAMITAVVFVAGHEYAPDANWGAWIAVVSANTLAQGAICYAMEQAATPQQAAEKWLRWLIAVIGFNGVLWGLLPIMVAHASPSAALLPSFLNALLLFCIASSPGTHGMQWAAVSTAATTNTLGLLYIGSYQVATGYVVLVAAISFYGWRLRTALDQGMIQRYQAEHLAAKLRVNQRRLVTLEQERALLRERQRLMRDMHDGLGSALVASLAAVERGKADPAEIALMLRECVDDLRTVIDSLEPVVHDLSVLLGTLRFRLQRRLDLAGIGLSWRLEDLPKLPWLGPPEALQVLRLVQEGVTNAVKHSNAKTIVIAASQAGDDVEVLVADDGIGFDPAAVTTGRGLRSFQQRATALAGRLEIETSPGYGTTVRLLIPSAGPRSSSDAVVASLLPPTES